MARKVKPKNVSLSLLPTDFEDLEKVKAIVKALHPALTISFSSAIRYVVADFLKNNQTNN